ncbi:MAG: UDP-N-acetylmuramoyl-L-alanyl-D-glutamate--2,6-diaminopimelate ligase [Bacteroidales bacterium]|nr:UDP-N-acetylmuramoyl-L-alanyl-D-glutamate--2,6-diaminopimelate ligase [Bacteroidales bacterium]
MTPLDDVLTGLTVLRTAGNLPQGIAAIHFDSRTVSDGSMFVAIRGNVADGHAFIEPAIRNGAKVILCEEIPGTLHPQVGYLAVKDTSQALGIVASNYYGNPSKKLQLVGITGTNGKTTTATLLHRLFRSLGKNAGLLSSIHNRINETIIPATHTTPDALRLNQLLIEMLREGCTHCFMEVSSHGIVQGRIAGLTFTGGIFTNLTHDHLDYHKTFMEYLQAKKQFFDQLPAQAFALINLDDSNGPVMIQNSRARRYTYALKHLADFRARIIENRMEGLQLEMTCQRVWFRLAGTFNAYNLLAAYSAAVLLGEDPAEVLTALSTAEPVTGRFDTLMSTDHVTAVIDYAHSPDALTNVLESLQYMRTGNQKLIAVVGAGGDRDVSKRPVMGRIAAAASDHVIFTSDNPRSEDPGEIIRQMVEGVEASHKIKVIVIPDRREALRTASMLAMSGDVILVAGKGHETYQEIKGVRYPFDDRQIMEEIFSSRTLNPI